MTSVPGEKHVGVCFVSPKAYPLFNRDCPEVFGGSEVDVYLLGTELAKDQNFHVSFIVADYGQPAEEDRENVNMIRSLDFDKNSLGGVAKIWRAMKKADADFYFIKTASPGTSLVSWFCRLHRKRFVYRTAHQDECDGTYLRQHRLLGKAFAASLRRADMVLAQNVVDADNLRQSIGVDSTAIPNGHRLSDQPEIKRDLILWAGRSADFKRPDKFLDLARRFPSERFVMICQRATGDESYGRIVDEAPRVDNLEFIERVPFDEVDSYFQRAKVLVNTSDSEGFPNTFIQACKSAAAILSLNVNADDFLNRYSCGLVCGGSRERLAEGLQYLLDENRYIEIGKNGRRYAEEHHDISEIVKQYKQLFRDLISAGC